MIDGERTLRWAISVPVFGNAIILRQLGLAIGIPFGLVALVIAVTSEQGAYTLYALGLVAAALILTWLFVVTVYRGKYEAEFALDDRGVLCRTQAQQERKNRVVNALTVTLGLFSVKPAAMGAGLLAQSRQRVFLRWGRITSVKYCSRQRTILLRGGWAQQVALFCTEENYPQVEQEVMLRTQRLREEHP